MRLLPAAVKPPMLTRALLSVPTLMSIALLRPYHSPVPTPFLPITPMPWASSTTRTASYFRQSSHISGSGARSPSMLYTPSTMTILFL